MIALQPKTQREVGNGSRIQIHLTLNKRRTKIVATVNTTTTAVIMGIVMQWGQQQQTVTES